MIVPARVNKEITDEIKESAIKIFKACGCKGMARVDFLVNETGVYFNEINTLPGFTNISMYPMLLQKSGLSYSELITRLIFSALK